ncbi:MAG: hypothetical protein ACK4XK_12000, partial [Casimicrobiaceae bacterium]
MPIPALLAGRLSLPVIAAPLFIISHPPLTIAQCLTGVVGAFPALNARPKEQLDDWLAEVTEGEPAPIEDHDELRWLEADRLHEVGWLPA